MYIYIYLYVCNCVCVHTQPKCQCDLFWKLLFYSVMQYITGIFFSLNTGKVIQTPPVDLFFKIAFQSLPTLY